MPDTLISVIINTCDRAESLQRLLYALNNQTYPYFEVIVVVGPTQDNTLEILEKFADRVRLVHCPVFNLSVSRNMGIAAAAGEIISYIDDDAIPSPTWLTQLAEAFIDPAISSLGGKVYQVYPSAGHIQFLNGMFSILGDDLDVRADPHEPLPGPIPREWWFPRLMGANMAFRRKALINIHGFDERFPYLFEEPDVAIRLRRSNYQTGHLSEAVVYHAPVSGRNREMFTWRINWYLWMRGIIYFTLKNGIPVAGVSRSLSKSVQHYLRFSRNVNAYKQKGELPPGYYPTAVKHLIKGALWGFVYGLFMPRKLSSNLDLTKQEFQPFPLNEPIAHTTITPFTDITENTVSITKQPLRICLLSLDYPPEKTDGIARSTHLLAQGLSELGHEVHVIKEGVADRVTYYDGAYVHEVRGGKYRYSHYRQTGYALTHNWLNKSHAIFERIQSLITNHQIQVVDSPLYQLQGLVTATAGVVPVVVRLVTGVKQIVDITQDDSPDTQLLGTLESRFLKLSQGIIANSLATKAAVSETYNLDIEALPIASATIYYGIKLASDEAVYPLETTATPNPIILFVGRLEKRKGILDLFAAIPDVLKHVPLAQFWLAGEDNSDKDNFREKSGQSYITYFKHNYPQCANNVHFLGYVPDEKLPRLYQECDLFVAPSLYESFGLIYLEAMNYARPVIGCRAGGPTEIIQNGVTGILTEPGQPSELAQKIVHRLEDRVQLKNMGIAGRQRLIERFSYRTMAQQFADFYTTVIS